MSIQTACREGKGGVNASIATAESCAQTRWCSLLHQDVQNTRLMLESSTHDGKTGDARRRLFTDFTELQTPHRRAGHLLQAPCC